MPDWPFLGFIPNNVFGEGSNRVYLSEPLATLITVSEGHWKNDAISFQNVYWHTRKPVNLRIREMPITYCVCDFLFYGHPCKKKENVMLECPKNMKFDILIRNIPF